MQLEIDQFDRANEREREKKMTKQKQIKRNVFCVDSFGLGKNFFFIFK